ncbi:ATP-binding protein [uncultured Pelagimonas sp.]|uniref:ATP-binding protein n=1 Tax=uncultured Pelagimonas sp. TaxID=1618102 RepID=UPI00261933A2|nr:ATP-binding protein [uncultured Pelagimonas sp.]
MPNDDAPYTKPGSFYTSALEAFDEPSYLMELMAKRFSAHSAVFWKRHRHTQGEFEAEGIYNRPKLQDMKAEDLAFFVLSEENVIFREDTKGCPVIAGPTGKKPFDKSWLSKHYTRDLVDLKIVAVATCPIATEDGVPFGAVSLYFNEEIDFSTTFRHEFAETCAFLYAMFTRLGGKEHRLITDQSKLIHEIMSQAESLGDSLKKIHRAAPHLSGVTPDGLDLLGDAAKAINLIRGLAIARKFQIALANGKQNATFTDIRDAFNAIMQPRIRHVPRRIAILQKTRSNTEDFIFVRLAPSHLTNLLANLSDNAIKYCLPGGTISPSFILKQSGALRFSISNTSKGIPKEERELIWASNYRGRAARTSETDGQGLGLDIIADICRLYRASYGYSERAAGDSELIVSTFWVEFPPSIVRLENSDKR